MYILKRTKSKYQQAILVEIVVALLFFVFLWFIEKHYAYSFFCGLISALLPFILQVQLFFTKKIHKINLTRLYFGEVFKFIFTIFLISLFFTTVKLNFIVFFIGYFLSILLNNLLPFIIDKKGDFHFK